MANIIGYKRDIKGNLVTIYEPGPQETRFQEYAFERDTELGAAPTATHVLDKTREKSYNFGDVQIIVAESIRTYCRHVLPTKVLD